MSLQVLFISIYKYQNSFVYCCTMCVLLSYTLQLPDCWLEVSIRKVQRPAGHLGTGFSWFPCVYKRMLRWFPRHIVVTACFSCSPPNLNFLVPYFIFMYMHNNHCHRLTAQLQLMKYSVILSVLDPRKCEYLKDCSLDFEHACMTTYLAS